MWFRHFLCSPEPQAHLTFWKVQLKVRAAELEVRPSRHQMFCIKEDYFFLSPPPSPLIFTVIPLKNPSCTLPSIFSLLDFLILSRFPITG